MRWFKGSAGKALQNKMRTRKKPVPPQTPAPKYKSIRVVPKTPPLRKPRVRLPLSKNTGMSVEAAAPYEIDLSLYALRELEADHGGEVVRVEWHGEPSAYDSPKNDCAKYVGNTWDSIGAFLAERKLDRHTDVKDSGITGVSHPGCKCHLTVELRNGAIYEVTVGDMKPALVEPGREPEVPAEGPEEEGGGRA